MSQSSQPTQSYITPVQVIKQSGVSKFWEVLVAFVGLANVVIIVVVFIFYRDKIDEANKSITKARDDALIVQGKVEQHKSSIDEKYKAMQTELDDMKKKVETAKLNLGNTLQQLKEEDENVKRLLKLTPEELNRLATLIKANENELKTLINANLNANRIQCLFVPFGKLDGKNVIHEREFQVPKDAKMVFAFVTEAAGNNPSQPMCGEAKVFTQSVNYDTKVAGICRVRFSSNYNSLSYVCSVIIIR